jgi:hypothetical protein
MGQGAFISLDLLTANRDGRQWHDAGVPGRLQCEGKMRFTQQGLPMAEGMKAILAFERLAPTTSTSLTFAIRSGTRPTYSSRADWRLDLVRRTRELRDEIATLNDHALGRAKPFIVLPFGDEASASIFAFFFTA